MWQKLSDSEIARRFAEKQKAEGLFRRIQKYLGIWALLGIGFTILDILSHFYFSGNYAGKTFRHPWYNLSDHLHEIPVILIKSLIFAAFLLLFQKFFFGESVDKSIVVCLKCQKTQYFSASCSHCQNPELIDFDFVEWVPKKRKPTKKVLKKNPIKVARR